LEDHSVVAGAPGHAAQKCAYAVSPHPCCHQQSGGNKLPKRHYRYARQIWKPQWLWALRVCQVTIRQKPSSGQAPWVEWCSSPFLVHIKTSKRPGGGGCIPI